MGSPDQKLDRLDNERDDILTNAQSPTFPSLVCNCHDLFNDLQSNCVVFDIREISSFQLCHVLGAYHMDTSVAMECAKANGNVRRMSLKDCTCEENRKGQYNKEVLHRSQNLFWIIDDNRNEKNRVTMKEVLSQCIKTSHPDSCIKILESFDTFQSTYPFLTKSSKQSTLFSSMFHAVPHYPSVIIPNQLYLGNYESSCESYVFRDLQLTHVINVASADIVNSFEVVSSYLFQSIPNKIEYCSLETHDSEDFNIKQHFDKIFTFIDKALSKNKRGRVLVHCVAGISRSSTAVIGYLMKTKGMLLYDAFEHVKRCRPIIAPNFGFFHQLLQFEEEMFGGIKSSHALFSENRQYKSHYGALLRNSKCPYSS